MDIYLLSFIVHTTEQIFKFRSISNIRNFLKESLYLPVGQVGYLLCRLGITGIRKFVIQMQNYKLFMTPERDLLEAQTP